MKKNISVARAIAAAIGILLFVSYSMLASSDFGADEAKRTDVSKVIEQANWQVKFHKDTTADKPVITSGGDNKTELEQLNTWFNNLNEIEDVLKQIGIEDNTLGNFTDYLSDLEENIRSRITDLSDDVARVSSRIAAINPDTQPAKDSKTTDRGNIKPNDILSGVTTKTDKAGDSTSPESGEETGASDGQKPTAGAESITQSQNGVNRVEQQYSKLIASKNILDNRITQARIILTKTEELQEAITTYKRNRLINELSYQSPNLFILIYRSAFDSNFRQSANGPGGLWQLTSHALQTVNLATWFNLKRLLAILFLVTLLTPLCWQYIVKLLATLFGLFRLPFAHKKKRDKEEAENEDRFKAIFLLVAISLFIIGYFVLISLDYSLLLDRILSIFLMFVLPAVAFIRITRTVLTHRAEKIGIGQLDNDTVVLIERKFWQVAGLWWFSWLLFYITNTNSDLLMVIRVIIASFCAAILLSLWAAVDVYRKEKQISNIWLKLLLVANGIVTLAIPVVAGLGFYYLSLYILDRLLVFNALLWLVIIGLRYFRNWIDKTNKAYDDPQSSEYKDLNSEPDAAKLFYLFVYAVVFIITLLFMVLSAFLIIGFDISYETNNFYYLLTNIKVGGISISFISIFWGILLLSLGYICIGGIARWIEQALLPVTRLDIGVRTAIVKAVKYVGLIAVLFFTLNFLNFDLSNISIIAGALALGLSFGMQSIISNFVSGLILLAERPIKIGDWIEASNASGIVTRIKVRCTEIETFDKAAVIIPNNDLITGVVTNLTHADKRARIVIAIGVGYDSDPSRVREILLKCAGEHPSVLSYPEPSVFFRDFGASSLDFDLRCYVNDVLNDFPTSSDLRFAIFAAFAKEGIEIPFPQRVVTVKQPPSHNHSLPGVPPKGIAQDAGGTSDGTSITGVPDD